MKRPWQIWLVYSVITGLLLLAAGLFTRQMLRMEHEQLQTRLQAQQEEKIRLALWRMDSLVIPIIAAEATRPPEAFFNQGAAQPFSVMNNSAAYVYLNFQGQPTGTVTSPQVPPTASSAWGLSHDVSPQLLQEHERLRQQLEQELNVPRLLENLPKPGPVPTPVLHDSNRNIPVTENFAANSLNLPSQISLEAQQVLNTKTAGDYVSRSGRLNTFTQQNADQLQLIPSELPIQIGTSRPVWVGDKLLLARQVIVGGEPFVQGAWLNWQQLQLDLQQEVQDLLPGVRVEPIADPAKSSPGRALAAIPVELIPAALVLEENGWSAQMVALSGAWIGLLIAVLSVGYLLYAVSSLSERRAAFVSAVTHELRTPLTTFQLYTEMLVEGVIQEPEQQREYLQILRNEAVRLGHLVENVLAYARLENRPKSTSERWPLTQVLNRITPHLKQRAQQAGMTLTVPLAIPQAHVQVDVSVVEQILLNLVDNAGKYGRTTAHTTIRFEHSQQRQQVWLDIVDEGPGIDPQVRRRLFQPFSKTDQEAAASAPGIGLGLALSRGLATQQGGDLILVETSPAGTRFRLTLPCHEV